MKIHYGTRIAKDGKTTFDVNHKWGRNIAKHDQCRMVIQHIIKKYSDAQDFEFFEWDGSQGKTGICGGRCKLEPQKTLTQILDDYFDEVDLYGIDEYGEPDTRAVFHAETGYVAFYMDSEVAETEMQQFGGASTMFKTAEEMAHLPIKHIFVSDVPELEHRKTDIA